MMSGPCNRRLLSLLLLLLSSLSSSTSVATATPKKTCRVHTSKLLLLDEATGEFFDHPYSECEISAASNTESTFLPLNRHLEAGHIEYEDAWIDSKGEGAMMHVPHAVTHHRELLRKITPRNVNVMLVAAVSTADELVRATEMNGYAEHFFEPAVVVVSDANVTEVGSDSIYSNETDNNINNAILSIEDTNITDVYDGNSTQSDRSQRKKKRAPISRSLSSIHSRCTMGAKKLVPYNTTQPIFNIALSRNASTYSFGSFFQSAMPVLRRALGVTSLHEIAEYVVLIAPNRIQTTSLRTQKVRLVSAGAYDSWKSVVTVDWIDTPHVLQHELGHNYNFGHAFAEDRTSVMGPMRSRKTAFNCYNGAMYDHAGWMEDYTAVVAENETATVDLLFYGHVNTEREKVVDVNSTSSNNTNSVNATAAAFSNIATENATETNATSSMALDFPTAMVAAQGFYMIYNRATGINAETADHMDTVLLHRYRNPFGSAAGSELVQVLSIPPEYADVYNNTNSSNYTEPSPTYPRIYRSLEHNFAVAVCAQHFGLLEEEDNGDDPDYVTLEVGPYYTEFACDFQNRTYSVVEEEILLLNGTDVNSTTLLDTNETTTVIFAGAAVSTQEENEAPSNDVRPNTNETKALNVPGEKATNMGAEIKGDAVTEATEAAVVAKEDATTATPSIEAEQTSAEPTGTRKRWLRRHRA